MRRVGVQNKLLGRVEKSLLRWFGYLEKWLMKEWQRGSKIRECWGRPTRVWMDVVKEAVIGGPYL